MTEVDNVDDLEAFLNGLSDDDLSALAELDEPAPAANPVIEAEPAPAPAPRAKRGSRKASLPPLDPEEPKPAAVAEPIVNSEVLPDNLSEDDLAGLDIEDAVIIEETPTKTAAAKALEVLNTEPTESPRQKAERIAAEREAAEAMAAQQQIEDDAKLEAELIDGVEGHAAAREAAAVASAPVEDEVEALLAAAATSSAPAPVAEPAPAPKTTPAPVTGTGLRRKPLDEFIDPEKLQNDLNFTNTDLSVSMAMTRQAALFAHYSTLAAKATWQSDRAKQQVDLVYANLDQQIRDDLTTAGTKFTEKVIESMIVRDSTYQAAMERAHEARAISRMVEAAADSFRHRKDMLIQIGADMRQEKQGKLVMKEHPGEAAKRAMS